MRTGSSSLNFFQAEEKGAEKKCTVVKNALKRIPTCNTWEDLFNDAIINISEDDLSDDIVDKYSKIASISVSREVGPFCRLGYSNLISDPLSPCSIDSGTCYQLYDYKQMAGMTTVRKSCYFTVLSRRYALRWIHFYLNIFIFEIYTQQ